jgi:threonyl-tRNA synthetase
VQLIEEKTEGQTHVSCYTIKDKETFVDFCVGPHVPSTGRLKAFKLLTTSNAYWKGDARNQPMQRVYGTAFLSEKELQDHLRRLEEAKKRDHRKIGRDQRLFMFHHWAPGATFWLPKGTVLYNLLGNYMRGLLIPNGYTEVKAPIVFNKDLWVMSGHWQHYRENMFLVESEGEQMGLKAMNCPGHYLMYASEVPQLSRSANPLPRADAIAPQRGVGRADGTHPRPAVQPGRWPLLHHGVADWRGGRASARPGAARARRLRARVLHQALDAA